MIFPTFSLQPESGKLWKWSEHQSCARQWWRMGISTAATADRTAAATTATTRWQPSSTATAPEQRSRQPKQQHRWVFQLLVWFLWQCDFSRKISSWKVSWWNEADSWQSQNGLSTSGERGRAYLVPILGDLRIRLLTGISDSGLVRSKGTRRQGNRDK